jgi:hypothetical protein
LHVRNEYDLHASRGLSAFDPGRRFVTSLVYDSLNLGSSSGNYPNATGVSPFPANPTQYKFWNVAAFDATSPSLSNIERPSATAALRNWRPRTHSKGALQRANYHAR